MFQSDKALWNILIFKSKKKEFYFFNLLKSISATFSDEAGF